MSPSGEPAHPSHHCDAQGAQGVKGLSPELAWPPQVGDLILIDCMYMWGENRHGNLGTYGRDGNGDNPLLYWPVLLH